MLRPVPTITHSPGRDTCSKAKIEACKIISSNIAHVVFLRKLLQFRPLLDRTNNDANGFQNKVKDNFNMR